MSKEQLSVHLLVCHTVRQNKSQNSKVIPLRWLKDISINLTVKVYTGSLASRNVFLDRELYGENVTAISKQIYKAMFVACAMKWKELCLYIAVMCAVR